MDKVKIGFIGVGFMGQLAHLQNYVQLEDCEVVAVADARPDLAKKVAAAYGIPAVYDNYADLLADETIAGVVASQQFSNHVNIVPDVLNAGKHILTEKPLCIFADNGRPLVKLAQDKGLIHMVGYHKRSDPATEYAMGIINGWKASGEMGAMRYIRLTMPPGDWIGGSKMPLGSSDPYPPFAPEAAPAGVDAETFNTYNAFVNYYIHQVNLLRLLFGEDYSLEYADKSGVLLTVQSKSGVCGIIEMATFTTSDDWQEEAMVCFEHGWVKVELPAPLASQQAGKVTVFADNGGGVFTSPRLPNVHAMKNQARNFIKAIKGEKPAPCPSSEAVKDLDLAMDYVNFMKKYK